MQPTRGLDNKIMLCSEQDFMVETGTSRSVWDESLSGRSKLLEMLVAVDCGRGSWSST